MKKSILHLKNGSKELIIEEFDRDKEIGVEMDEGGMAVTYWLSPNQANELVKHLVRQLTEIGELQPF